MALTVNAAFAEFLANIVNLDAQESNIAKSSRSWLMNRVHELPEKDAQFPRLYAERDIHFGSFERKTKKKPLDDIDTMVCMAAQGATWNELGGSIYMDTDNAQSPLYRLRHADGRYVNSRRVINKFVDALVAVPQYKKAEIGRCGEAVVLNLTSYDWSFDIVPCFFSAPDHVGRQFYIIPDGNGHWKKTDPRIDRSRIQELVAAKGRDVLDTIRLVKYWNRRSTMQSMGSYLIENLILCVYENMDSTVWPDLNFMHVIDRLRNRIYDAVQDPKGMQGDLNNLGIFDRWAISNRCDSDLKKCMEARNLETVDQMKEAINKWAEIFGPQFPTYG